VPAPLLRAQLRADRQAIPNSRDGARILTCRTALADTRRRHAD
jgi:hypothetical protein